jgi:GT2 family glycosyltransferase
VKSITVVDNGSTDGSMECVAYTFPDVTIIPVTKNLGFAAANNIALRISNSKYVALINNDAVAEPDWLHHLVKVLELNPQVGMAASKMVFHDNPDMIDRAGDAYSIAGAGVLRGRGNPSTKYQRREKIFGACAGAAVYRRSMLEEIGMFDEDFFLINEDVDLSFRAQLAGHGCLFVPEAVVHHNASRTIGRDSDISVYYGHRNLEWVYYKNMPGPLIVITILPHLAYNLLAGAYFFKIGKGRVYWRAKLDAMTGLRRVLVKRKVAQRKRRVPLYAILRLFSMENPLTRLKARYVD